MPPSETDSPALPSTEISAAVSSPPLALPPAGQDGRDAQRAVAGEVDPDTTAGAAAAPIPIPSSEQRPAKQAVSQRHPSNTFYRSCEISFMEPVGSMSISPANRDVVLAARKGLFIIDLEDPFAPPRFLAHMTTWEAVDIQWSPHPARSNWVASTSNQKLLIWNLDRPGDPRAAPPLTRMLHRGSIHSSSSPIMPTNPHFATQRSSAYQSIYNSQSLHSGLTAGTRSGYGAISAASTFGETPMSAASQLQMIAQESSAIEHVLHAHTRAITDINWSPFHPEIVASSSIDTWTWVWDLRMSGGSDGSARQKPAQGYSAWNAAVTQVKFNRASEHRLASTCDNKVLIWDDRKGSLPLATIEAHENKIYGIDWSRETSLGLDRLVTCSLDRTVKFWDLASDTSQAAIGARELVTEAESMIETRTPVWRARHLPFGNGVMTLPQRGDTTLSMWAKDEPEEPKATFSGHTDIVKEYLFRTKGGQDRGSDDRQFQLITWSKDQTLRLWPVSDEQTRKVGHKPGGAIRVLLTRANAPDISYRDPPLALPAGGEDAAMLASQASGSNITTSSILPPEHATRSLLSGKGSGSRIHTISPYSSSMSGFQSVLRDGRTSPLAPFGTSAGHRSLNHSSSHGDLGVDLSQLSRSPMQTLARSLPKQAEEHVGRLGTSYHSSKYEGGSASQQSGGGQSSFKVPASWRGKHVPGTAGSSKQWTANNGRSSGRPLPIQEERSGGDRQLKKHKERREKERASRREERRKLAKASDPKKAVGAAMRLDRGRAAAPAVDPIEWIANVRLEKELDHDRSLSEDHTGGETSQTRDSDGIGPSRLAANRGTRMGFGREGLTTEDDTDAESGFPAQKLGDEIIRINRKLPRIVFEKVELTRRMCVLTMYGPWADHEPAFLRIKIRFPAAYPRRAPHFDLEKSANISIKTRAYLLRGLSRLSTKSANAARPCLEICARFLIGEPIKLLDDDGNEEDGVEADVTTSRDGATAESESESGSDQEQRLTSFRPARRLRVSSLKLKMPARRMGASFGPNNELVVFGGSLNHYAQSRDSSRQASRSASQAPGKRAVARNKSVSALSRAQSRTRRGTDSDRDSEGARSGQQSPSRDGDEESRFLRSYTALANAMSSLARYSRTASGGVATGYSVRDSDVVQLMSTDFFARRLLRKKDFFDTFAGSGSRHGGDTPLGKDRVARHRASRRFYSGSGASTPGVGRGEGERGAEGSGEEVRGASHHVDLLGSLPAPAAVLALDRLKETQRRRQVGLVTVYQLVEEREQQ
ncbi:related to MTC5-subunit of the SEA complex [Sporisorium reilianum f. sp. reilianum]|uniref:Related to MTC5-subunit of the SEA complex n=1 Tax=Sporisorium reilianum f. sp. reilianum TaxID=72559 RepID=A0A2N8UJI8_9BASI|nr:related to MTC5-subunit of the SEA complex [Sporisorium reilianum f. sp. reilianum]